MARTTHKRKKVALAFIADRNARRSTYRKRKSGLLKKIDEITTLCGVDACAILSSPFDGKPEIWPNPEAARRVVDKYMMVPEMEKDRRTFDQQQFLRQSVTKLKKKLDKQLIDSYENEVTEVMNRCLAGAPFQNLYLHELHDLVWTIDHKLNDVNKVLQEKKYYHSSIHAKETQTSTSSSSSSTSCSTSQILEYHVPPPPSLQLPVPVPPPISSPPTTLAGPEQLPSGNYNLPPLSPPLLPVLLQGTPSSPELLMQQQQQQQPTDQYQAPNNQQGGNLPWQGMDFGPNGMAMDPLLQMETNRMMMGHMMITPPNQLMQGFEDHGDQDSLAMMFAVDNYDFSLSSFLS
ncbi:hypothetical protein Dimus_012026 [Dionaea muscipula]